MNVRGIRPLPEAVINQIAAGEVIERPASIVKELVENALDAGAGSIEVEIDDGGIARIQVRDDGGGIAREELALALTRHCTSKIASADDLPVLVTLGFRGEALAAIAAVADTSLVSRTAEASHGWRISQGAEGKPSAPEPVAHPRGTTVVARELFARVPARRRFLKRAQTEALHVQTLIRRIAFCTPAVGFTLSIDGVRQLHLPAAQDARSAERRQRALFGAEFAAQARYVDLVFDDTRIAGWVAGPALAHAQADLQMFAVNGRIVRDRHLLHAVRSAFDERLPPGRHACFALHLELPPAAVDVNVHPGKLEVRFRDLRSVHDSVHAAVRQALATPAPAQYAMPWAAHAASGARAEDAPRTPLRATALPAAAGSAPAAARAAGRAPPALRVLAVLEARYALIAAEDGACAIDLGALVEATLRRRLAAETATKPLLIPLRLECPDAASAARIAALLATLDIETSALAERVLALRGLPLALPALDASRIGPALVLRLLGEAAPPVEALAAAAAEALLIPPAAEQASWLQRLLAAAREAGVDDARHTRRLDGARLRRLFSTPA
ncbi:MAG TPA: DNA mismatch repair endonuclease MutL [Gammaproteobacteria bacterium]|nr:DNA mismatch repair endonuclease MutL [Gammaproteobacteria bacterium]